MKKEEQDQARALRKKGHSINEIVSSLNVAKSSVSLWVRDIELTKKQRLRLSKKGRSLGAIENRRNARLKNERARRSVFFDAAKASVRPLTKNEILHLGLGLYWGEGSKTNRGSLTFFNSDPRLIQIMMRFFEEICEVPRAKFRGHVLLHHHLSPERAERYWRNVAGLPRSQFYKTSLQHNKKSKNKKDTLSYGTFALSVCDTQLFLTVMGWMEGSYNHLVPPGKRLPNPYESRF